MKKYHPNVNRQALMLITFTGPLILLSVILDHSKDSVQDIVSFIEISLLFYLCIKASYLEIKNERKLIIQWWLSRRKIEIESIFRIYNIPLKDYWDVYSARLYIEYKINGKNYKKGISSHWFSNKDLQELLESIKKINPNADVSFIPNADLTYQKWGIRSGQ